MSSFSHATWIWNAGKRRQKKAVGRLLSLLEHAESEAQTYALCWALGRCGDGSAIPALEKVQQRVRLPAALSNMVTEALRALTKPDQKAHETFLQGFRDRLPAALKSAQKISEFDKAIRRLSNNNDPHLDLYTCYVIDAPYMRKGLCRVLDSIPLEGANFQSIRSILKASIYRADAEVFGLLSRRLDETFAVGDPQSSDLDERAYSIGTRTHLRRHLWHSLRRLAATDPHAYLEMATHTLLAYDDELLASAPHYVLDGRKVSINKEGAVQVSSGGVLLQNRPANGKKGSPYPLDVGKRHELTVASSKTKYYTFTPFQTAKYILTAENSSYGHCPSLTVEDHSGESVGSCGSGYRSRRLEVMMYKDIQYSIAVKNESYWGDAKYTIKLNMSLKGGMFPRAFSVEGGERAYTIADDAVVFNHILYDRALKAARPGSYRWQEAVRAARALDDVETKEAFPDLWVSHPEYALRLLQKSASEQVHAFALRVLQENPLFCDEIPSDALSILFKAPYTQTRSFALEKLLQSDVSGLPEDDKEAISKQVPSLLASPVPSDRQLGLRWLELHREGYLKKKEFVIGLLLSDFQDVRQFVVGFLNSASFEVDEQKALFASLLGLLGKELSEDSRLPGEIQSVLENALRLAVEHADAKDARALLSRNQRALRLLGLKVLEQVDESLLIKEQDLLYLLCSHQDREVRLSSRHLLKRLAEGYQGFAKQFSQLIINSLTDPAFGGGAYNIHFHPTAEGDKHSLDSYKLERRRQGLPDNDGGLLPLDKPERLIGPNVDDRTSSKWNIGFSFRFGGKSYSKFSADSNGWLSFAGHWGSTYSNYHAYSQNNAVGLFPWWADLHTAHDGYVRTQLIKHNDERVRVVEWRCTTSGYANESSYIIVTFQVCLFESDHHIEFRYGAVETSESVPYCSRLMACGAALDTSTGVEGRVRDFFGHHGYPAGSAGPFRTDLVTIGDAAHFPGGDNVGIREGEHSAAENERQIDIVQTLLWVFEEQCKRLPFSSIVTLLTHSLEPVQIAAAELLLLQEVAPSSLPEDVFEGLFRSPYASVRRIGIEMLSGLSHDALLARKDLLFSLYVDPNREVQDALHPITERLLAKEPDMGVALCLRLLNEDGDFSSLLTPLLSQTPSTLLFQQLDIFEKALTHVQENVRAVIKPALEQLCVEQPAQAVLLGARLIRKVSLEEESVHDPGESVFVDVLLERIPRESHLDSPSFLLRSCAHHRVSIADCGLELFRALILSRPDALPSIVYGHIGELLRRELFEGEHARLCQMFWDEYEAPEAHVDKQMIWRLLFAFTDDAKDLGAALLQPLAADTYSLKQLATFAGHELRAVREVSWRMYRERLDDLKMDMLSGLRILDVDWEDSRSFAFDFYREQFDETSLTASILVGICDSVRDDVQRFGRELITRFFGPEDGPEYLEKLSQHPAPNVEFFVTNYLERFASGQPGTIKMLEPYFKRVLCRVKQGRDAKERVLAFLQREAAQSEQVASFVADLFGWLSMTQSVGDKATYIAALVDIQRSYPDLDVSIRTRPIEVRGGGQKHAV